MNSLPESVCNLYGDRPEDASIDLNALATSDPFFDFIGTTHAYLLKQSITVMRYAYPSLYFFKLCKSTRSACHCSSIVVVTILLRGKYLRAGLWRVYVLCPSNQSVKSALLTRPLTFAHNFALLPSPDGLRIL